MSSSTQASCLSRPVTVSKADAVATTSARQTPTTLVFVSTGHAEWISNPTHGGATHTGVSALLGGVVG